MVEGIFVCIAYSVIVGYVVIVHGNPNMTNSTRSDIHRFIH